MPQSRRNVNAKDHASIGMTGRSLAEQLADYETKAKEEQEKDPLYTERAKLRHRAPVWTVGQLRFRLSARGIYGPDTRDVSGTL